MSVTRQLPLRVHLQDYMDFEAYVAGPNDELIQVLKSLADIGEQTAATGTGENSNPADMQPRMCYLHARPGSGRTHLLQAICRASPKRTLYFPLQDFLQESPDLTGGIAAHQLLCLDDIDCVAGDEGWQRRLVAVYDDVRRAGGCLIASGRLIPQQLDELIPDLRSRLSWGAVYGLKPLDDDSKLELLQTRARLRGLAIGDDAARYLLSRTDRDVSALMLLINRLDQASMASKRKLTLPFVREVLHNQHQ